MLTSVRPADRTRLRYLTAVCLMAGRPSCHFMRGRAFTKALATRAQMPSIRRGARFQRSKRVERWRESEFTAKGYAAEVEINANALTLWGWRLRGVANQNFREWLAWAARSRPAPFIVH